MSSTDQVAEAMARLDDETRALLELSSRSNVSDDDLADLLRLEREEVAERRRRAELRLRLEMGDTEPEQEHERDDDAPSRRGWIALVALTAVGLVVLLVVVASGGGDNDSDKSAAKGQPASQQDSGSAKEGSQPNQPAAASGPVRPMQVLNDTHGRGSAQLVRSGNGTKLRLKLSSFLAPHGGGYAVWLYNSQDDSRRLYATTDTAIARDLTLPGNYKSFQYVDVARAVPDLDSDHSGLSLLRVRVADLAG